MPRPWALRGVIRCDCGGETVIVNSRGLASDSVIRRERQCKACGIVVTTYESRRAPAAVHQIQNAIAALERAVQRLRTMPHEDRV